MSDQKYLEIGMYRDKIEKYEDALDELGKALGKSDSIDNGVIDLSDNEMRLSEELVQGMGAVDTLLDSLVLDPRIKSINLSLGSAIDNTINSLENNKNEAFSSINKLYEEISNSNSNSNNQ